MSRPPEPNRDDLRNWRRLIRTALMQAEDPLAPAGELDKAAAAARRSVAPSLDGEPITKANPFIRLQRLAVEFAGSSNAQRRDLAPALKALAEECGGLPPSAEPAPGPAAPRRHRADLDG